jgi:hypothetical protein
VITERELLQAWKESKTSSHFYRLKVEIATSFEYRGPQFGHPSNYAAITLVATPSAELCLESVATYPASVSEPYARQLLSAVGRAAVDEFFAPTWDPYRGCKLVVQEVGWDEIMSSEVAIYRAARGALAALRQEGKWELAT